MNWKPGSSTKSKKKWSFDDWKSTFKISERELVNPKLSYWEKSDLYKLILRDLRKYVTDNNMENYINMNDHEFEASIEKIFPKYMLYDTYNINYTPTKDIEFEDTDEQNEWLFKFLMDKSTGYYTKTVTQNNTFNSFIYSSEIIRKLLQMYTQENPEGPGDGDGEDKDGNGQSGMEKMLSKMLGSGSGNQQLDQAMEEAQNKADERINDNKEMGEGTGELGCDKSLGDFSLGEMANFMDYTDALENIAISEQMVSNFVKTTLKLSQSYFSTRYTETQVEVLEADILDDMEGLENLVPGLRALGLEDLVTHERKYHMKFDVYVDCSGSMDTSMIDYSYRSKRSAENKQLLGIDLAKVTALKLRNLGFVDDVYPFEGRVYDKLKTNMDIALMQARGGTNINRVVEHVAKIGKPSVVITDMHDSISVYDSNVYFIGILGAGFENFKQYETGKKYLENKQCVRYDSANQAFVIV